MPGERAPHETAGRHRLAALHSEARGEVVAGLLRDVPHSVALHHDLSTATGGAVRRFLRDAGGELASGEAPLVNECACCALREDLVPELERLAGDGVTQLAVLELWDSVEPKSMAEVIAAHTDAAEVTNVVTAIDPTLVLPCLSNGDDLSEAGLAAAPADRRTIGDTWARQVEYAPVLAVTPNPAADDEDRALIRQLNPTARQAAAGSSELARLAFAGFDVEAAAAGQHPACALLRRRRRRPGWARSSGGGTGPSTPSACSTRWRTSVVPRPAAGAGSGSRTGPTPCSPGTRRAARSVWRTTALARLAPGRRLVHGAALPAGGRRAGLAPRARRLLPAPGLRLPGLDREGLTGLLDSCLLTDEEYGPGREAWKRLPAAFDALLEPVH